MKSCIKCTSPLYDNDRFCPICGAEQVIVKKVNNNFCVSCGCPVSPNIQICPGCGKVVSSLQTQQMFLHQTPSLIRVLSNRINCSAIIWQIIATFQLLFALLIVLIASLTSTWNWENIFTLICYVFLGVMNTREAVRMFKYKDTIVNNYIGIIYDNRICASTCLNYVWNIFVVISGLFTAILFNIIFALVIASAIIIDFALIRLFIKKNKESFLQLEKSQLPVEEIIDVQSINAPNQPLINLVNTQVIPPLDKNNRWFEKFSTYTLQQLEGVIMNQDDYQLDAYSIAEAIYVRRVKNIEV